MTDDSTVFVSSTCEDMIDIRAELEVALRDMGFSPMLSDRTSSEFVTRGDGGAIETCLVNVRKAGAYICILSQRYGSRLTDHDVSATHLEYRAAREARIPTHFYVRDRLIAEYGMWSANGDSVNLSWVPADQRGLFKFLKEREDDVRNDWRWPFSDSVQLKQRIARDLGAQSRKILLRRLLDTGRVPVIRVIASFLTQGNGLSHEPIVAFHPSNIGSVPALAVQIRLGSGRWQFVGDMIASAHNQGQSQTFPLRPSLEPEAVLVRYSTLAGEVVEDAYELSIGTGTAAMMTLKRKTLLEAPSFEVW